MDGGETSPGCKWDANIRTWIEVRHDLDEAETLIWVLVWRWDVNMGPWIELRCNLDWGEMQIYEPWWRRFMDEGETRILWPEFRWEGPGWKFDAHIETWMGLRWCRGGSEMQHGKTGMEVKHHLVVQRQIYGPGLRWDTIWMGRKRESRSVDWGETLISGNGWGCDGTWTELSCISWYMERLG